MPGRIQERVKLFACVEGRTLPGAKITFVYSIYVTIQKVPFLQVNETVSLTASKVRLKQEKPLKINSNKFKIAYNK